MQAKTVIKYVVSFLLAGVLVFFAFRGVDWKAFWGGLGETRLFWLGMFVVFSLLALVFREERWRAIINPRSPTRPEADFQASGRVSML